MDNDLKLIKGHYEIALNLINLDKKVKAKIELFNTMPSKLYDKSLDIMDDRNHSTDQSLKNLIKKVHKQLGEIIDDDEDIIPDISDANEIF